MSMSSANATAFVRSLIKEASAKFWTDAEITLNLATAMSSVWAKYSPWLFETYKKWADLGVVATTADYTISTAIGTDCYKISKILNKEDGDKLLYIHDDEMYKYRDWSPGYPVGWTYKGGTQIALIPTPNFTDTDYLQCYYMPKYTDITTFPDCLQPIVCVEAVIYCKTKDEDVSADLIEMRNWHEQAAMIDLAMSSMGKVEIFPDYLEEDTLE